MPKLTRTAEIEYYVCDVCGEECIPFHRECCICGKVVCPKATCHTIHGDNSFCKFCWSLQDPYLKQLYDAWEKCKAEQVEINAKWREASIKSQEQQNGTSN